MTSQEWIALKNGTDVRGVALDGVLDEPITLTDEVVEKIAAAFCVWLSKRLCKTCLKIAVGHDSRLSAERLMRCVEKGIVNSGCEMIDTGLSSTPSMFMLLQNEDWACDGSIEITASHLPFNKNGLKFFVKEGGLESVDITSILHIAEKGEFLRGQGSCLKKSYIDEYAHSLVEMVRRATGEEAPLQGKRILVDAGNGAGGFYVDKVLKPLGADTAGSQFLEPDGRFPNHIPNPENKEAMRSVCDAVKANAADFGIIFDTDVDRAGAVDKNGEEINRNRLIALISAILLEEQKDAYIVTDSVTSDGLAQFIALRGGVHHRFKRGYKNVINESKRLNSEGLYSPLAIETSGHAALKENYFLDDGAYLVTRILISLAKLAKEGKELSSLIEDLPEPKEAKEIRLTFLKDVNYKMLGACVISELKQYAETVDYITPAESNYEGIRLNFDREHGDGWILVRMSLHEPIMPINLESNSQGGVRILTNLLYRFIQKYEFLNLTNIQNQL